MDEFPLLTFVGDVLQQELFDIDRYDGESPQQKLPEIPEFKDTDALAVKLFEQFQSLPWKYTLFLKLPEQLSKVISEVLTKEPRELSASLRLVKPDETLAAQYPINSEVKSAKPEFTAGDLFFFQKFLRLSGRKRLSISKSRLTGL